MMTPNVHDTAAALYARLSREDIDGKHAGCDSIKVQILAAERRRICWVPISAKRSPRVQSGLSSCRLFKHKRTRIATGAPGRSVNQKSACFFARYGAGSRHTDRHGFSSVQRLPSYDWWNFIVDTGHVPSWPLMEIRKP